MKHIHLFLLVFVAWCAPLSAWKGTEANGDRPIFYGTLKSRESNTFSVTNVTVGRSTTSHDKIMLYEMPKELKSAQDKVIKQNPHEDLTTSQLELLKIKKIEVPEPQVMYKWFDPESKRTTPVAQEFIELIITWRSGSTIHYLLQLGQEDSKRQVKVYCDVLDKPVQGVMQDGTLFCPGIDKTDLRKKGAPFPSIQVLELEEPCFKVPTENVGTMKKNTNN